TSNRAREMICMYFLAQNKDILTVIELEIIVLHVNDLSVKVKSTIAKGILDLIKLVNYKTLLIVDKHGVLFEKDQYF
ncbi:6977_t:CDS:1, partial [Gigaspora margarita]